MSENAKKKKRKGPSLEKQLEEAIANHAAEYKQWHHYWTYGGQDPSWPDGCNMHLIRNHIEFRIDSICQKRFCTSRIDIGFKASTDSKSNEGRER